MARLDVQDAIALFGGAVGVRPDAYPETEDGWKMYLRAIRVLRYFKPVEFTRPVSGGIALAPRRYWPQKALCALLSDEFRLHAKVPVRVRYLYRDPTLNAQRGGAPGSDHLTAHAVDLECLGERGPAGKQRAMDRFVDCLYGMPGLAVSVGIGRERITHLGALSPAGQRRWRY